MGKRKKNGGGEEQVEEVSCILPICSYRGTGKGSRGLCRTHYHTALKLIKNKRVTWEQLVRAGKATEASHGGEHSGAVRDWFLEAAEDGNGK